MPTSKVTTKVFALAEQRRCFDQCHLTLPLAERANVEDDFCGGRDAETVASFSSSDGRCEIFHDGGINCVGDDVEVLPAIESLVEAHRVARGKDHAVCSSERALEAVRGKLDPCHLVRLIWILTDDPDRGDAQARR